jgi:thioredoxin 1
MSKETTDISFEQDVLNSSKPVLVDFWAEWCGPCRQLSPIVDELSKDRSDKIEVYKLNIDKNPEIPTKHGIRGIPTLILFKDGKAIATKVGSLPKSALYEWVDGNVA